MEKKTKEMESSLNAIALKLFGRKRDGTCCVTCGSTNVSVADFRDAISLREYEISRMCQACQDSVFCEEEQ